MNQFTSLLICHFVSFYCLTMVSIYYNLQKKSRIFYCIKSSTTYLIYKNMSCIILFQVFTVVIYHLSSTFEALKQEREYETSILANQHMDSSFSLVNLTQWNHFQKLHPKFKFSDKSINNPLKFVFL